MTGTIPWQLEYERISQHLDHAADIISLILDGDGEQAHRMTTSAPEPAELAVAVAMIAASVIMYAGHNATPAPAPTVLKIGVKACQRAARQQLRDADR